MNWNSLFVKAFGTLKLFNTHQKNLHIYIINSGIMKRFIIFYLFLLGLGNVYAQETNPGPQVTKEPSVYKGVIDKACAIEVNFGSYAAGIDGPAMDKVMALITKNKLANTAKNIGREGETRICLPLTELKGRKRNQFINQLKKIAKEGELVSLSIR